jgi:hypothetical protein
MIIPAMAPSIPLLILSTHRAALLIIPLIIFLLLS